MEVDILIKNALIITVNADREIIKEGSIAIKNGKIFEIFYGLPPIGIDAEKVIDGKHHLVMPGWVNTHTHAAMSIYRGLADDLPLMEWLEKHIWPAEAKFGTEQNVRLGTQLAMHEMIQSGTTCFSDMYFYQDAVAEEVTKVGMRVVLGEGILDFPTPSIKDPKKSFTYVEALIKQWQNEDLVTCAVSPHAPYTVSEERLRTAKALANKYDVIFHTHLSETAFEVQQSKDLHGLSPVEYLDSIGLLDDKTVAAHCVHLSPKDIEIIQHRNMAVAHNPQSNMKLGSGIPPIQQYLDRGIRVGVGTDGVASNNNLNMFEELDVASKLAKAVDMDATRLNANTMLEMGTIKGAEILGLADKIGSIEIGKQADIQIIDLNYSRLLPIYHPSSHIIYAMNGSEVRHVIVNGQLVMEDRIVKGLDTDALFNKVRELGKDIRKSLN